MVLGETSCLFQEFAATPGSEYALRCAAGSADFASLTISFSDSQFVQLASDEATVPGTALSTVSATGTAPANTVRGAATLYADDTATFDNCVVVEL